MKRIVRAVVTASCLVGTVMLSSCGGGSQLSVPPLTITTSALPNGIVGTPYSQPIQASGGVAPYSWTVTTGALPNNLAISTNRTNSIMISGIPDTAAQAVAFTLQVTDSAHHSARQPFTVSILLAADTLTFSPDSLDFGVQPLGLASGQRTEVLTNTSNVALMINSIATTGANAGDYRQTNTCAPSLAGGTNCTVDVTFTPAQLGPRTASITITNDTAGSPHSFVLNGMGGNPGPNATLSATSLDFGNQVTDTTSAIQSLILSNYGTATLNLFGMTASTPFSETHTCGSGLPSGASCTIDIIFTPVATGSITGTVTVNDNASGSPQTVSLTGTGVAGACIPKGMQCRPKVPCCAGLVCRPASTRAFCEP